GLSFSAISLYTWRALVVQWLGFGALTAAARVRFPVREAVFWPPLALTRRERPAKSNSFFEPESNQRPKDVCLFNYSPPLYQLSYRRSWRWSGHGTRRKVDKGDAYENRGNVTSSARRQETKHTHPGTVAHRRAHWTSSEQWKKAIQRLWVRVPPESCAFKDDVQRGAKTFCCALPTTQKGFLFLHLIQ